MPWKELVSEGIAPFRRNAADAKKERKGRFVLAWKLASERADRAKTLAIYSPTVSGAELRSLLASELGVQIKSPSCSRTQNNRGNDNKTPTGHLQLQLHTGKTLKTCEDDEYDEYDIPDHAIVCSSSAIIVRRLPPSCAAISYYRNGHHNATVMPTPILGA